jgi:hypothetical protein
MSVFFLGIGGVCLGSDALLTVAQKRGAHLLHATTKPNEANRELPLTVVVQRILLRTPLQLLLARPALRCVARPEVATAKITSTSILNSPRGEA